MPLRSPEVEPSAHYSDTLAPTKDIELSACFPKVYAYHPLIPPQQELPSNVNQRPIAMVPFRRIPHTSSTAPVSHVERPSLLKKVTKQLLIGTSVEPEIGKETGRA